MKERGMVKLCSIPDCGKPHYGKGYCWPHYLRWRKHGDPLKGGTPYGDTLRFIHEVAMRHTSEDCLTWPFGRNDKGYGNVRVNGKPRPASRYVCELAHGAPPTPKHEAAHSCGKGNEGCVAPGHLSWKTHKENMADKLKHDTHSRGERNGKAKLTEDDVLTILSLKGAVHPSKLIKMYGVSRGAIAGILAGRNWAWLSDERTL